jgi:hypothetical protein
VRVRVRVGVLERVREGVRVEDRDFVIVAVKLLLGVTAGSSARTCMPGKPVEDENVLPLVEVYPEPTVSMAVEASLLGDVST